MSPRTPPVISVQAGVIANLRNQPIGKDQRVADLGLPEAFLRRIADRIIRESFQDRFRLILADDAPAPGPRRQAAVDPTLVARVVERTVPGAASGYRRGLTEDRPPRRSYRAPILSSGAPSLDADPDAAAAVIGRRLAFDGVLSTLVQVIEAAGTPLTLEALDRRGFPTDLLAWFSETGSAAEVFTSVSSLRHRGAALRRALSQFPFRPVPSCPGFRADADSGRTPLDALRAQVTSGSYWSGPGDGGCLDVISSLTRELPDPTIIASIQREHAPAFAGEVSAWRGRPRLTLIPEDLPVAQWAQDNAKTGTDANGDPAILVPRFASRGEAGAVFVPGETFIAEGLSAAGFKVVQSPLHFQGGDLILVEEAAGARTLLVGEAEVWRNTMLGLSREQVLEALRVEFDADRCIDLPSVSFHIDFELSVRAMPDRTIAFVNDVVGAARVLLGCALPVLVGQGLLTEPAAAKLREHLAAQRAREVASILGPALETASVGQGHFSAAFARHFSTGPHDHGPSNLYRILHAFDVLTALGLPSPQWPADPQVRAYLETYVRQEADRKVLRRIVAGLGWRVASVPSLSDPSRGINSLNGLHGPGCYLMPSYPGLLAPLDAAAEAAFVAALGESVKIVRIGCAETQRRSGALRCAISHLRLPRSFGSR